jgi:glutamate racemase
MVRVACRKLKQPGLRAGASALRSPNQEDCLTVLRHNSGGEPSQLAGKGTDFAKAGRQTHRPLARSPPLVRSHVFDSRIIIHPAPLGPAVTPAALPSPTILVFDSGLGGLTVYREIAAARPDARFVYAADDAVFPYGALSETALVARVVAVMENLIEAYRPDLVVVACNTASTLVLPRLRTRFAVPFVGTVPAIKPACAASTTRLVSVLGTEATVKREYTHALIREFAAGCEVTLVGSARLAALAESELRGEPVADAHVAAEIAPCFVNNGTARTDTIVLACTHYPLLIERMRRLAPWPVDFLDPAPAIARRVVELIGPAGGQEPSAPARAVFTSGRPVPSALAASLGHLGIRDIAAERFDTPQVSA